MRFTIMVKNRALCKGYLQLQNDGLTSQTHDKVTGSQLWVGSEAQAVLALGAFLGFPPAALTVTKRLPQLQETYTGQRQQEENSPHPPTSLFI